MSALNWLFSSPLYWWLAVALSLFHGMYCIQIHHREPNYRDPAKVRRTEWLAFRDPVRSPTYFFQFWFNLVCSMIGWICAHYLFLRVSAADSDLTLWQFLLGLVAALGVVGYLPNTLHGIAYGFRALGGVVESRLKS